MSGLSLGLGLGGFRRPLGGFIPAPVPTVVFGIAGQSNSTSRGAFDGGADWPAGVKQLSRAASGKTSNSDLTIIPAARPLDHETQPQEGGFGFPLQFSIEYLAANPNVEILLVPGGYGGSSFSANQWNPGDPLYTDFVSRMNFVLDNNPAFTLGGILWHQGESDSGDFTQAEYTARLDAAFAGFRSEINRASGTTPIILGGLLESISDTGVEDIVATIDDTPDRVPYTALASSAGLVGADIYHFNAAGYRTIGSRYFAALPVAAAAEPDLPGAITDLAASPGTDQITLSHGAPAQNRSPITGYRYEYRMAGAPSWSDNGSSATITGLTESTDYECRAFATNGVGEGPASNVVTVTTTAVVTTPTVEADAQGHWLFGSDNPAHTGLVGGDLAVLSAAPSLSPGYLTVADATNNGLRSGIADSAAVTLCIVARRQSDVIAIFAGNLPEIGPGIGMFRNGAGLRFRTSSAGNGNFQTASFSSDLAVGDWRFMALSIDASGNYETLLGDALSPVTASGTIARGQLGLAHGIGSTDFGNSVLGKPVDFAEFIVFDTAKTATELQDIYARSQGRMADRGITLL